MSLRETFSIRERFEDVLFLTKRHKGVDGLEAIAQVLAKHLTEEQLRAVIIETSWADAMLTTEERR